MKPWGIFVVVLLLVTVQGVKRSNDSKCKFDISLTQKIENEGFHREILWLLERSPQSLECKLAIKLDVPKEVFINPDQIADLNRLGQLAACIEGDVDIEVPSHLGTEHTVYIFVPPNLEKVSINLPFHLRYQRAQISGGFGKVIIKKPSILAICPKPCGKVEIKAPCDVRKETRCVWNNVTYQALFDELELLIPIGDLDDYPLVSIVTLLLGCAGCIYTLSVLSTTPL